MKIKYEFATETVEVEVTDDWGSILVDLETRRHCSLDAYNLDNTLFPSDVDVLRDILKAEDDERLHNAIAKLEPRQQKLIWQMFFEERGYTDIARAEGLDESAVRHATTRALKKLKKFL
jgi:RNA polymerase sigma factor (sigma-70 family)